jgi:hypothetical protein
MLWSDPAFPGLCKYRWNPPTRSWARADNSPSRSIDAYGRTLFLPEGCLLARGEARVDRYKHSDSIPWPFRSDEQVHWSIVLKSKPVEGENSNRKKRLAFAKRGVVRPQRPVY